MSLWTAWLEVPARDRAATEQALDPLAEKGFVVTSRELSRDGPWRIEIYGQGDRMEVQAAIGPGWRWEELPDKDWVAENQRSFQPFTVGPFWVHPSHIAEGQPADTIPLRIDAGMAFGTGTHATTRGCLELIGTLYPQQVPIAVDVGCGSGILAIAIAKLFHCPVLATDNDAEAVRVAKENAEINDIGPLCHFFQASGLQEPEIQAIGPFELIVANILAGPLLNLVHSFTPAVKPGGRLLLSGLLVEQAANIIAVYGRCGFTVERHIDLETGGAWWRTLLLRRRSSEGK